MVAASISRTCASLAFRKLNFAQGAELCFYLAGTIYFGVLVPAHPVLGAIPLLVLVVLALVNCVRSCCHCLSHGVII